MLVLTRLKDESIVVIIPGGQEIRITIVDIERGKVKIGFEGDRQTFSIFRSELLLKDREKEDDQC
jgi:carbon storage regulator CsrA